MPCTPSKARAVLKAGKARPKRNKLGLFYLQLTYEHAPDNQPLVVGIDPGSKFEGFSVVGTKATVLNLTVLNLMVEAPDHVKKAVKTRRTLRRARRFRLWRRPCRNQNRLSGQQRLPPSTRSRWEAKARIVHQLLTILPLTAVVVEDVQAATRPGPGRTWNASFSPVQVGKAHLYGLLRRMGLMLHLREGWQTQQLRVQYGLTKTQQKDHQTFNSHAVDAWVLAAWVSGAEAPTCTRLWYVVPVQRHRRQLQRLQADKGGVRKPYGGDALAGLQTGHASAASPLRPLHDWGLRPGDGAGEPACLPHQPAPHPSRQASRLSGAHGGGVSRVAGATAAVATHPTQTREEDGAASPGH
jgi:hypothetical protein